MKKKIIIVIVLILLIVIGIIAYFTLFKKEKGPEFTYVKDVMAASSETKYLSASVKDVLAYLNNHNITGKTDFNKMNIKLKEYQKCSGTVTHKNGTFLVEANCGNDEKDGYATNFSISSKSNLKSLSGVFPVSNGDIYYGKSKADKRVNVGFLDYEMNIVWEAQIPIKTNDVIVTKVNVLSDGYLVVIANLKNDEIDYYDLVKIDKNGKVIKQEKTLKEYNVYNTSNDVTLLKTSENSVILLDKDIKRIAKIDIVKPTVMTIEKNSIYFIDESKNFHIIDKNGKEKKSFELDTKDEGYMQIEVVNNKIFVVGNKNITTYDKNGNLLDTFNYSDLRVDKSIYNLEHNDNVILSAIKLNDLIYVNVNLEIYSLLDYYDSNLKNVHRNIYEVPFAEIGSISFNPSIIGGDVPYNLSYSEEYSRFVKINYID